MTPTRPFRPLLLIAALTVAGCDKVRDFLPWQRFSVASASMEPTLAKGRHVTGEAVKAADLSRGDIVIVRRGNEKWLSRVAALPGDRIALVDGIVILNGKSIRQRPVGRWTITDSPGGPDAVILSEHFPKERRSHRVLDDGPSIGDNFKEIELGLWDFFVLGDNRDHAADSRFDEAFVGLGVVKAEDILRRVTPPED